MCGALTFFCSCHALAIISAFFLPMPSTLHETPHHHQCHTRWWLVANNERGAEVEVVRHGVAVVGDGGALPPSLTSMSLSGCSSRMVSVSAPNCCTI